MGKRAELMAKRKAEFGGRVDESPFKAGTKQLKKGWKYVNSTPVKVAK